MPLASHYLEIKLAHIALVSASGALFALRGGAVLAGAAWPLARPLRIASMAIDSALLVAGATLWAVLGLNPVRDDWLGVKLVAVVVYIVLGTFALKRAKSAGGRAACYVAALAVFGFVVSIALAHDPRGIFARWF